MKVLTDSGLTTFWNKIKSYVSGSTFNASQIKLSSGKTVQAFSEDTGKYQTVNDSNIKNINTHLSNTDAEITSAKSRLDAQETFKSQQTQKNTQLDTNMANLNTRDDQIDKAIKGIAATGGASTADAVTYDKTNSGLVAATVQGAIDEVKEKLLPKKDFQILCCDFSDIFCSKELLIFKDACFAKKDNGNIVSEIKNIEIKKASYKMYWLSSTEGLYTSFSETSKLSDARNKFYVFEEELSWSKLLYRNLDDALLIIPNKAESAFGILSDAFIGNLNNISISNNNTINNIFKELLINDENINNITEKEINFRIFKAADYGDRYITGFQWREKGTDNIILDFFDVFMFSDYRTKEDCKNAALDFKPQIYKVNGCTAVVDWSKVTSGETDLSSVTFFKDRATSTLHNQLCSLENGFYALFPFQVSKDYVGAPYNSDGVIRPVHDTFHTTEFIKIDKPTLFYGNFWCGEADYVDSVYIYDLKKNFLRSLKTKKEGDYVKIDANVYVRFVYESQTVTKHFDLYSAKDIRDSFSHIIDSRYKNKTVYWFGDSLINYGAIPSMFEKQTKCITKNFAYSGKCISSVNNDGQDVYPSITKNLGNDADLILISAGVNDHRLGVELGDFTLATAESYISENPTKTKDDYLCTFYGALHTICRYLIDKYNQKIPVVFLTPMHNAYPVSAGEDTWEIDKKLWENSGKIKYRKVNKGGTLPEYVEAIKKVAAFYGMQVIDTYSINSLQPSIKSIATEYFLAKKDGGTDGIHPNYIGAERICKMILPKIESLDYSTTETDR